MLLEAGQLVAADSIGDAVRGEDAGEEAEVLGDAVGEGTVGSGDEVNGTAEFVLRFKKTEDSLVVREVGYVEGNEFGCFGFGAGFAAVAQPRG